MTIARRTARRAGLRLSRRARSPKHNQRRSFLGERLEQRMLLAGDVMPSYDISPLWNHNQPLDVDGDKFITPTDALIIINDLNANGARPLPSASELSGEGMGPRFFVDVDNDFHITPTDALLIINRLNAGPSGEGVATVAYRIVAVPAATPAIVEDQFGELIPATPLTSVTVGNEFDLVVLVQDLHTDTGDKGVFAGYLDILVSNHNLAKVSVSEIQRLRITGTTFNLELGFQGATTTLTNYNPNAATATNVTRIRTALESLPTIGAGNVQVASRVESGIQFFTITFVGTLMDQNVPLITATGGGTIEISAIAEGVVTDPVAFTEAWRSRVIPPATAPYGPPDLGTPSIYQNGLSAALAADRYDEVGAFSAQQAAPGPFLAELVRVRIKAMAAGTITYTPDFQDRDLPLHNTSTYRDPGEDVVIPLSEINPGPPLILTINPVPAGPITANPDTASVLEDSTAGVTINVLANDVKNGTPPPAGTIGLVSFTQPATGGTVTLLNNNTPTNTTDDQLRFVPAPNFYGEAVFTYTINLVGGITASATGTVTVTVIPVNDPPTLNAIGNVTVNEDSGASTVTLSGIAPAANSPIPNPLELAQQTVSVTATSNNPSVVPNPTVNYTNPNTTGTLVFTPAPDANGSATITVRVQDNGGTSNGGVDAVNRTFTITVNPVNDPPVNTVPGAQDVDEDTALVFSQANGNQISVFDVDGGNVQVTLTLPPNTGTLSVVPGAATVTGNNSANLTITGSQAAVNAALNGLTYTPPSGFTDSTTLTVSTSDLGNTPPPPLTDTDTVLINVIATVRPRARNDLFNIDEGATATLNFNVLANDLPNLDPPGTQVTLLAVNQPFQGPGSVAINNNGTESDLTDDTVDYTPPADTNFFGDVRFTYVINDTSGVGENSTATVTIRINNVPDAPVAVNDLYGASTGGTLTVAAAGVLANDFDVDNNYQGLIDPQTVELVSGIPAGQGTLVTLAPNGGFTYIPGAFGGDTSFTYRIRDSFDLLSNTATVTIHVAAPPSAVNDAFDATEDSPRVAAAPGVLANDTDPTEGQPLSAVLVQNTPPNRGTVELGLNGSFTFTPSANFFGTTSFTYNARAEDGRESLAPATVTITVAEVNDPPTAVGDTYTAIALLNAGFANQTLGPPSPLANDSSFPDTSPPGDFNINETLTISAVKTNAGGAAGSTASTALGGSVSVSGGGTVLLYTPPGPAGPNPPTGADSFVYTLSDGRGGFADATVTVNVINFVPKTISGTVYIDNNGDGVPSDGDQRLAGVKVILTGVDELSGLPIGVPGGFNDAAILAQDLEPDVPGITRLTDSSGNYSFANLRPGTYTLTEIQPLYLLDGPETENSPLVNTPLQNDTFQMSWQPQDQQDITGLNFIEGGINILALTDPSGLLTDLQAKLRTGNGFVIAVDYDDDSTIWSWTLNGWNNVGRVRFDLDANLAAATVTLLDHPSIAPFRIYRYPNGNNPPNYSPTASFRILGYGPGNTCIIRVDGTAADFGITLAAAETPPPPQGEGVTESNFTQAADAIFALEAWA